MYREYKLKIINIEEYYMSLSFIFFIHFICVTKAKEKKWSLNNLCPTKHKLKSIDFEIVAISF